MKVRCVSLALTSVIVFALSGTSLAAWGDGPGCGLGKVVFDKEPKSILFQHFGSTLNVPSQPFAISSGTSGCTNNGMIVQREVVMVFVSQNLDQVSQDMAKGQGEYMSSLATLMGIPADRQTEFFLLAQELFWDMMQRQEASHAAVEGEDASQAMLIALQEGMRVHAIPSKTSPTNSTTGDLISDSMLMAQSTSAPGGRGGGSVGEPGRADVGTQRGAVLGERGGAGESTQSGSKKQGMPGNNTTPKKVKPGMEKDTAPGGSTGSESERTGKSSGSPGTSGGAGSGTK